MNSRYFNPFIKPCDHFILIFVQQNDRKITKFDTIYTKVEYYSN